MAVELSAHIPSPAFHDYPVDVQISVWPDGQKYMAYIQQSLGSQCYRLKIDLTPHDVQGLNQSLQESISRAVQAADPKNYLPNLAEIGNAAYKQVFRDEESRRSIQSVINSVSNNGTIQITCDDFALPWDLLYDRDVTAPLSYENFWGMRYLISRVRVVNARPGDFVPQTVKVVRPTLGLLTQKKLQFVLNREIPFFTQLHADDKITLVPLRELDPYDRVNELQFFTAFWEEKLNIAHLACHAFGRTPPFNSYIEISNDFKVSVQDMQVYNLKIENMPLVILNGCHTGDMNPFYTSSIAGSFLENGARGVIATECAVPDKLAAEFTEQIYTHLLGGEELGVSLMRTRAHLMRHIGNPVGLLYALYAPPNFKFDYDDGVSGDADANQEVVE